MKIWYKFLFLPILIFALVGCSDDEHESVSLSQYKAKDGKVTQLQKHTIGKGVPIIIMCDGITDKDITNGVYRQATTWALEGLFSVHPMKSLRDYFDVYEVTAACYPNQSTRTDGDSIIYYDNDVSIDIGRYEDIALGVIGEERYDDVTTIVLRDEECNSCAFISPSDSDYYADIPTGYSLAYVAIPFGEGLQKDLTEFYENCIRAVLLHEAIGHGFAKLADEYVFWEESKWDDYNYEYEKEYIMERQKNGFFWNVSFDSDVTKSYWADFASDSRYDFEKLGCYEGGYYQEKGVYRPTENSIMRHNYLPPDGYSFNVVGRAMIYKRCMKIAYGDSWKFNYEDFVKFDLEKAKAEHEELRKLYPDYSKSMRSCAPPRFVDCVSRLKDVKTRK